MTNFLTVEDIIKSDYWKDIARIDLEIFSQFKIQPGASIELTNPKTEKQTVATVFPSYRKDAGVKTIKMDALTRHNLGLSVKDSVIINNIDIEFAQQVSLARLGKGVVFKNVNGIKKKLLNFVLMEGDIIPLHEKGERIDLIVINHTPQVKAVKIYENTQLFIQKSKFRGDYYDEGR